MKVRFWGTRGSLPAPLTAMQVRAKVLHALEAAHGLHLPARVDELAAFVDQHLPFHVRSTCGGNTACVQLNTGHADYVLLDAGTGIRDFAHWYRQTVLRRTRVSFPRDTTFHLFLTHLHWDHVQGLPFFYPLYLPDHRIIIYGGHDGLEDALRLQFSAPSFPVPYDALKARLSFQKVTPGEALEVAGLQVQTIAQDHPGGSFGYRFTHAGRSCVYSTDCEHKQPAVLAHDYPFLNFFADTDLLIFDAMYSLADASYSKADWGHSSNIMGVELAARARVKRLALFHHDPHQDDAALEAFLFNSRMYIEMFHQEQRKAPGAPKFPHEVLLAYDGLEVEL